jgi:cobalt-zinc-cadmium efflux system outer membrane protein
MNKLINVKAFMLSSMLLFAVSIQAATHAAIEPVQDRVLTEFIQNAVAQHPLVLAEKASVDTRSALERAAGKAIYNPELDLDAESATDDTYSLGINQTIDFGNKRKARKKVAASELSVSAARLATVRKRIASVLLNSLAQFHSAEQQLELAGRRLEIVKEFSELANRRYRAGDLNQTELNLADLALTQAKIEYATQKSTRAEAEQDLRLQSQISSTFNWPKLPTSLPSISSDKFNTNRLVAALPEVQAAKNEANVSTDRVNLRQRERKPDPTIGIRGGEEGSDTLVGINLSIPLYVRNNFNEEVVAAQSEQREAEYRHQNILNSAHTQLIAATNRYQVTQEAWHGWENSGQSSYEKQTKLLQRLWEAGELSTTDYLVQLNQALDTQASATELRQQLWASWFNWLSASGEINNWLGLQGL